MQRFLDLSGGPLHIRQYGEGADHWFLVHGLGASSATWTILGPKLKGRVTAIDLPGFGLSPPWKGNPIRAMRSALTEALASVGSPVILVGNSMGGLLGAQTAAWTPSFISELVLIAPATPTPRGSEGAGLAAALRATTMSLRNARSSPADRVDALLQLTMVDPARVPIDVREQLIDAATAHLSHGWAWPALARSGTALYAELLKRDAFVDMLARVVVPTLVIWGLEDRLVRPVNMRWLQELRPDWQSVPMADIGHAPMMERPQKVVDIIGDWRDLLPSAPEGRGYPESAGHS